MRFGPDANLDRTVLQLARDLASDHGLALTNYELEFWLWEATAFPASGIHHTATQLDQAFADHARHIPRLFMGAGR